MLVWTLKVTLLGFYLLNCIDCDNHEHHERNFNEDIFYKTYYNRNDEASGKALEDICDCDSIEIVTTKVNKSKLLFVHICSIFIDIQ